MCMTTKNNKLPLILLIGFFFLIFFLVWFKTLIEIKIIHLKQKKNRLEFSKLLNTVIYNSKNARIFCKNYITSR